MNAILALVLAASAAPAANTPDQCDALWDATVTAAAPDLTPTDELRKSFLAKERAQLLAKCVKATPDALACPPLATKACSARFPQPPDGGRALGLATCVYPEVQACVQQARLARAQANGELDKLLARVKAGELKPEHGVVKLPPELADLSLGGVAPADATHLLLLTFNERNTRLRGLLLGGQPNEAVPALAGKSWRMQAAAGLTWVETGP